jgi:hypothetical protein
MPNASKKADPAPPPPPSTLPIDATSVALDNLKRINEANRWQLDRKRAWEAAKVETKDRKSEYDDAVEATQDLIVKLCGPPPASIDEEPLPLIDGSEPDDESDDH